MPKPLTITGDTTLSSKYQIVIPKDVREILDLQPGQRIHLSVQRGGVITLTPAKTVDQYIGILGPPTEDPITYQRRLRRDKTYA